jgi:hypothetical protein
MTEYLFDHNRLDVDRLSIEYIANAFESSMLTRMAMKFDGVSERPSEYTHDVDYEHEHRPPRRTEHEHEEEPEQSDRDRGPVARATLPHHLTCGSDRVVERKVLRGGSSLGSKLLPCL